MAANTFQSPDIAHFPFTAPPGWDFLLPVVYVVWAFVVVALCPLCRRACATAMCGGG